MKKLYKLWAIMTALFMVSFVALSVNAQNKQVQVEITWWTNECTFNEYTLMQTGFSYAQQVLESNPPTYTCTMEAGNTAGWVTIQSNNLVNPLVTPNIPAANVTAKHGTVANVTAWACALSDTLATSYAAVDTATELFTKDDYTVCTVEGSTQLEVTVPASLPVWIYTGNIVFVVS